MFQKLKDDEAVLSASYQLANRSYHSIAIGFGSICINGLKVNDYGFVDTNTPNAIQVFTPELFNFLGDGLYLRRI